jgi:hypothetical protein
VEEGVIFKSGFPTAITTFGCKKNALILGLITHQGSWMRCSVAAVFE